MKRSVAPRGPSQVEAAVHETESGERMTESRLPTTKRPWKIQVHEAVEVLRPRLEAVERITILIEDPKQAALIRYLLPPSAQMSGFLRIALA